MQGSQHFSKLSSFRQLLKSSQILVGAILHAGTQEAVSAAFWGLELSLWVCRCWYLGGDVVSSCAPFHSQVFMHNVNAALHLYRRLNLMPFIDGNLSLSPLEMLSGMIFILILVILINVGPLFLLICLALNLSAHILHHLQILINSFFIFMTTC